MSSASSAEMRASRPVQPGDGLGNGLNNSLGAGAIVWWKWLIIGLLFVGLYWTQLKRLWVITRPFGGLDPDWAHAICVPLIGIYYLFLRRDEIAVTPIEPVLGGIPTRMRVYSAFAVLLMGLISTYGLAPIVPGNPELAILVGVLKFGGYGLMILSILVLIFDWGIATLVGGLLISAYAIWPGRNNFVGDVGMVMTLFGVVLTLCGWGIMRIAWFPIIFLICALPWPEIVYSQIASPLQHLAAKVSVTILQITGLEASYHGTKIFIPQFNDLGMPLPDRPLNVAEACAGLRSLMTFITVAAAVAFLSARPLWQKLVITLSAIPIAISCNVVRVAGQGLIDHYIGREWSEGFAHQFAGMIMMLPAFLLIMLICWIVDQIFIEEAGDEKTVPAPAPGGVA
jgi:exosortase